ncbi:uncharacterized protein LOC112088569 [Eutrema salsugineum]|uniref:uncharacterized protein LOC112088569 n=1 Tax=Eutrema salsugineum TaxID=72664 RepID=UPI000CED182A|nr:uncharacterized protein LOC112088569 [Eutrema salsugineum]
MGFEEGWTAALKATTYPSVTLPLGSLVPWLCWNIWTARNNLLFSAKEFTAAEVVEKAVLNASEWINTQAIKTKVPGPMVSPSLPLPLDTILCRTDAAWKGESQRAGLGWIFLSRPNEVTRSFSLSVDHVSSPLMAESLAL